MRFLGARRAVLLVAALGCSPLSSTESTTTADRGLTARAVPLITGVIDENNRVILAGNTRGEALRPDFDRGRRPATHVPHQIVDIRDVSGTSRAAPAASYAGFVSDGDPTKTGQTS